MNCRTCDYPLWNLKSRACPECNTPFAPSQFLFQRQKVAFCCPHCDQPYYGRGEGGHLEPRAFSCVKCARAIHEDEMVLRPGPGVAAERTRFRPIPWFDPAITSFFSRLVQTSVWALFLPWRLGRRLPTTPDRPLAAVGFAATAVLVMLIPGVLATAAFGFLLPTGGIAGLVAITFLCGAVGWGFVAILPWAVSAHFVLASSGSTHGGFKRTLACMAYGVPACLPLAIPLLGMYIAPVAVIYWAVLSIVMIGVSQRVSWWRSIFAVSLFPVFVALCIGAFILLVIMPGYRSAMATMAAMQSATTPSQQAATISTAILAHAGANAGAGPVHMSDLLFTPALKPEDLLSGQQYRTDARASIGGVNFATAGPTLDPKTIAGIRASVRSSGPIIAHRLGDVVFTYHGIDLTAPADPGLWMFVITTEASRFAVAAPSNSGVPARPNLAIACADGSVAEIPDSAFRSALDAQNELRVSKGLLPLKDPRNMTANDYMTPAETQATPASDPP